MTEDRQAERAGSGEEKRTRSDYTTIVLHSTVYSKDDDQHETCNWINNNNYAIRSLPVSICRLHVASASLTAGRWRNKHAGLCRTRDSAQAEIDKAAAASFRSARQLILNAP